MKAADLFPFRQQLRAGTLAAVSALPEEHWAWKPSGGVHSIKGWLWHIAETEERLWGQEPRRRAPRAEKEQVLAYLAETRALTERFLLGTPAEALLAEPPAYERLQRIFEHETHHRAQIYLYLRLMGLQPPRS